MNPENSCQDYRYETEHFLLRQVKKEDAPELLRCYSDPAAVALMNDDNCVGGFLFRSLEEMETAIHFWNNDVFQYARPAVIDKRTGEAVGTLEIFGGETGVLRVDLRSEYERPKVLRELYSLAMERFPRDFPMGSMVTKAPLSAPARREVLGELGFTGPEEFREYGDYYRLSFAEMRRELGIAVCALACCLCSENRDCPGCREGGCPNHETCVNYLCSRERGVSACWECPDFPCGKGMHGSTRIQAFAKFAREQGVETLLDCLERNRRAGVVYHRPGTLTGDYDLPTEREIFDLLLGDG
ncbi:DUF3795 domain-containing protein [Acutalibacter sp. 1XD8-33]|uniref:DUF3795 domain-containing protein n=1 Tax=Acutalibacter sp. 1XD8-33 TaxID=2320081 RepID=UPI0026C758B7